MKFTYLVFGTAEHKYLYDAITNRIFTIADELYLNHKQILDSLCNGSISDILSIIDENHSLRATKNDVEEIVAKGLFMPNTLQSMDYGFDMGNYLKQLDNSLHRMILEITRQCNLRCGYCSYSGHYLHKRSHENTDMSFSTACRALNFFLERIEKSPIIRIDFYGGEPLLELEKIKKIVEYSEEKLRKRNKKRSYEFTTNGTLLKDEFIFWLDSLLQSDPGISARVAVTLNGPEKLHDKHRVFKNGRGSFNVIINNLKNYKRKKPELYNKTVVFQGDYLSSADIPIITGFFDSHPLLKGRQIQLSPVDTDYCDDFIRSLVKENPIESEDIRINLEKEFIEQIKQKNPTRTAIKTFLAPAYLRIHNRCNEPLTEKACFTGTCRPLLTRIFVSCDGRIHICEKMSDFGGFGHVNKGINKEKLRAFLEIFRSKLGPGCMDCYALRFCNICHDHVVNSNGYDQKKHLQKCANIKTSTLESLRAYCEFMEKNQDLLDLIDPLDVEIS